jgi:hypothetical protein
MVKDTAIAPLASADGWSATPPATYTLAAPGTKTLYAWAKDQIGNVSVAKSAIITIDTTPPNITTFAVKTPAGMNVPITAFVATDNIGIGGYLVTETPATPAENDPGWTATKPASYLATTSGVKTLYGWVKDKAGNISTSVTATATVDAVPPVVTAFVVPTMAKAIVPITTFTATDNNGVTGYMITTTPTVPLATAPTWKPTAPTTFSAGTPGVKTLYAWAKDAVGNVSAASTATVTVDMVVPVITSFKVQTPSNSLTVNITDLTATDSNGVTGYLVKNTATPPLATAADWSAAAPATYTFATPGVKILYAWAKDAAGNVSMVKTAQVAITVPAP